MGALSYIFNIIGVALVILSSLVKGKRMEGILVLLCAGNLFVAVGYLCGGSGINGSASCFIGFAITLINYFFERSNKPVPSWLNIVYGAVLVAVNLLIGGVNIPSFVAIAACIVFILGIFQKSGKSYRIFTIFNIMLWCTYDLITTSFGALTGHSIQLAFALFGIFYNDILKKDLRDLFTKKKA